MKKLNWWLCLVLLGLGTGCADKLQQAINETREVKYVADNNFADFAEGLIAVIQDLADKREETQIAMVRESWAVMLKANGMEQDAEGNVTGGSVDWVFVLQEINKREAAAAKIRENKSQAEAVIAMAKETVKAYRTANQDVYASEQEAKKAMADAKIAADAALKAAIGIAGYAAGMFIP